MERPYFLDEYATDFNFWFEVYDYNTDTEPSDTGHEPEWGRKEEWDDDFKTLWKWAGNHGLYNGGKWNIAPDHPDDAWVHQYTFRGSDFHSRHSNTDFWKLVRAIDGTREDVFCSVSGEGGEWDAFTLDGLEEDIEEECWTVNNKISYHLGLIGNRKNRYVAYELKGIPAERNGTVIIKEGNTAFFVGHKRRLDKGTLPSEEAKVLMGEIRDGQVIPERPREEFMVQSTSPERIYDIAEDIFASHEMDYMEKN
jgi:hypothetical protein